jgi:phasin family protein
MSKETQSLVDIVRQFGSDLGLPKVDVDKLVETHRKNFEALTQTALVASDGLKSLATKQKEMVESAFREALEMARNFKPSGDPQQILAKQGELARKAFDAAIDHTKQIADQVSKSQAEALKIATDRIVASIAELRASFEKTGGADKPKS